MGLMDKLKGLLKGRETQVKQGIDTVSDQVEKRVGPQHAAKVDDLSDKAKEHVDKLTDDGPDARSPGTPPAATTPSGTTSTPSAATTPPPKTTPPVATTPPAATTPPPTTTPPATAPTPPTTTPTAPPPDAPPV